jgi:Uma2 family endonuclease
MALPTQVPIALYLHTTYEPDAEYIDGAIEERPMGEFDHSAWQAAIQRWFFRYEDAWNILVCPELRVQTSTTRFRVPDVAILDASLPREPFATNPPLAVFEVLSPEDYHTRLIRKLGDYEQMGIPAIWVIDPQTGLFERFADGQLARGSEFSLPERGIHFFMAEIAKLVRH